ncbi:F0F1 ATP synthase subunit A [Heliobacillus mobilis]|uniref:ATP synthase subunit a n=2 Tax=Heliobacterium TaxID=2697 RepID=A0A6I3SMJ0_HELMO|nr:MULTISPECIES: F0F1 ATP synthase subunit A [Heliobacterium]MBC9784521.1 F0F1 ATP synthase subunit A [Heliobacterium chlorum]MTV49577.1 F0F1 ATP synthase subunit A [Heliobacterium mobile]
MGEHTRQVWHFMGMSFWADTLLMTWIVMAFLLVFGYIAGRRATTGVPDRLVAIWEYVIDFVSGLITENTDYKKLAGLLSYLCTLIMFIFFANMLGLFPNFTFGVGHIHMNPNMMSPTADLNTTMALATLTIILVQYYGIKFNGSHYFGHFFTPNWVFFPIHAVELVTKPVTLAFRLYGNIYAGEVLISVLLTFLPFGVAYAAGGFIPHLIWLSFSVFVGAIQSFVFTVLTIVYIAQAIGSADAH